tara:strand:+ start:1747 stop:2958 length:1212 start_codon:yes stop_codon:yes gene_type:complete
MKKKILIFSLAYFPKHVGGAEVALQEITNRISSEKFEFHLVCNRFDSTLPKTEQIGNVTVHRIGITTKNPTMADLRKWPLHLNKIIFQFLAFYKAKQLHKTEKFDGVWAMMAHATGVPAQKFKRAFPDAKYILTLQEGDPPEYIEKKMRLFGKAFDRAFTTPDTIQVISSFLGNWAKQKGYNREPVLIPNAVNTKHFTQCYTPEEISSVRTELGFSKDDVLLVTTSRLVTKNAIDDVISSLVHLPENVKFVVFGTGPDNDMLKALAAKLNVSDRVLFFGQIEHSVMPLYLKACNIFIRPSRSEGMGNSFVEAMAAGLPVIATQEGGIADFLFDEEVNPDQDTTGWAVPKDNPKEISKAVMKILSNPEKVDKVTIYAKTMVMKKYDWDIIAGDMEGKIFSPLFD